MKSACWPMPLRWAYLSIAAHGHADALAFTLSLGGEEFLIDPGTYAYHTQKLWRDYFRGTYAHNTVRVDEVDQSEIGGNFMWMRKARATLLRHEAQGSQQSWAASHDGYRRLPDPVTHTARARAGRRCPHSDGHRHPAVPSTSHRGVVLALGRAGRCDFVH